MKPARPGAGQTDHDLLDGFSKATGRRVTPVRPIRGPLASPDPRKSSALSPAGWTRTTSFSRCFATSSRQPGKGAMTFLRRGPLEAVAGHRAQQDRARVTYHRASEARHPADPPDRGPGPVLAREGQPARAGGPHVPRARRRGGASRACRRSAGSSSSASRATKSTRIAQETGRSLRTVERSLQACRKQLASSLSHHEPAPTP